MTEFIPLESIDRQFLSTKEAAYYLNRQPQTLRNWSIAGNGPIKCVRLTREEKRREEKRRRARAKAFASLCFCPCS